MRPQDYAAVKDGIIALDVDPPGITGDDLSAEAEDRYREDHTTGQILAAVDARIEVWRTVTAGSVRYVVRLIVHPEARHDRVRRAVAVAV